MLVFLPIWERFLWWSKVPLLLLSSPNSKFLRNIYSITFSTTRFLPLMKGFFYWRHCRLTWPSGSPLLFFQRTRGQSGGQSSFLPLTLIPCILVRKSKIEGALLNITYGVVEYSFWYFYIYSINTVFTIGLTSCRSCRCYGVSKMHMVWGLADRERKKNKHKDIKNKKIHVFL